MSTNISIGTECSHLDLKIKYVGRSIAPYCVKPELSCLTYLIGMPYLCN